MLVTFFWVVYFAVITIGLMGTIVSIKRQYKFTVEEALFALLYLVLLAIPIVHLVILWTFMKVEPESFFLDGKFLPDWFSNYWTDAKKKFSKMLQFDLKSLWR